MIRNVLAWLSFALAMLFAALAVAGLMTWQSPDGGTGGMLVWYGAVPLLVTSIVLVVALLVVSAFQSDS